MANKTIRDFHGSFNVSEAYTTYKSEDQINEATPPSGPKNPDKPHVGKTAHEKKVERYQQYLAKKKRDREQHLRNNPGLTQNRRQPVSQNAFYSKRAFRNQEINASYDPDLSEASKPEYEVKYSSSKRGPIKVTKFMTQDEAQAFLKKIRGEGMNGIVSKGGKPVRTPMKEDAKSERLAKIARAAAAREKDQAAQKEKEKEKHYAASKKSRAAIDYLKKGGNKDQFGRVREEEEITESDKAEYDKLMKQYGDMPASKIPPKTYMRISQLGRKVRGDKGGPKVGDLLKSMKKIKMGEEVEQTKEANQKYDSTKGDKQARRRGEKEVGKLINKENPKAPGYEYSKKRLARLDRKKKANEEVEQTDESLRQRADDSMTFGNRQAAFSTAFKKKHGRAPTKQELRDAGVGKGGDNPAGAKSYQKAMSKLRPASRSGIKDKFVHNEEVEQVDEAKQGKMGTIAAAARKGMPPYTIVAIQGLNPPKVVAQETTMIASAVPAHVKEMKSKYPKAKISVEGKSGKILHTEQVNAEARKSKRDRDWVEESMIGRTKPSRELNVQKFEKKYLGTKSLKDAKRAAHKAERKKGKMDIQKGD